ncbi:MAG: hypothetical protein HY744_10755 [Deltaproteobacteria bacterium]|nr:hypothetical protein [Deltaproteobacteria bacterium]
MLPPFIIQQIRQREEEQRRRREEIQPRVELPLPAVPGDSDLPQSSDEEAERGVIVVDLKS